MNTQENPLQLVKLLKGPALAIVIILLHENKPVGAKYLERWSGYSYKTIREILAWLSDPTVGLVRRVNRCAWQLSRDAFQTALIQDLGNGSGNFYHFQDATTTSLYRRDSPLSAAAEEISGNFYYLSGKNEEQSGHFHHSLKLLREAGIGEPTASRLANLGWMTPEYILAHVENAKRKGIAIPLLIHKMRSNDPAPEIDDPEDYRRYISGPLGYLIEH